MGRWLIAILLGLTLLLGACSDSPSSSDSDSDGESKADYAKQMCDTNEGGYYHIDENCFNRYMGR